jgi:hypothetical protein
VRRAVPAIAAVALAAGCTTTTTTGPGIPVTAATSPQASVTTRPAPPPSASPSPAAGPRVAIQAAQLPYKPAAGMPALGNVSILRSAADPCTVPADDSGDEAQLINAELDVTVVIVTFEFTNPCATPLVYDFTATQAIGSAHGPTAGDPTQTTTPPIQPGQSITFRINDDPSPSLTSQQLQSLWIGITHISKEPAH